SSWRPLAGSAASHSDPYTAKLLTAPSPFGVHQKKISSEVKFSASDVAVTGRADRSATSGGSVMNKSHNALLGMLLCFLPLIGIACLSAGCGLENCQARFLAGWSADGTRVALGLAPDTESVNQSGVWF